MFGEGELARPNCGYFIVVDIDNVGIDGIGGYFGHSVHFDEMLKILGRLGTLALEMTF